MNLVNDNIIRWALYYLIVMNLIGFLSMAIDKKKAQAGAWRIPEKTLFLFALLGGSIGSISGMYIWRHKTKHITFVIGMPLILIGQIVGYLFFTSRLPGLF